MEQSQYQEVIQRTDVVSYALLAEINHFHSERSTEVKKAMKIFLCEQVAFYQKVRVKIFIKPIFKLHENVLYVILPLPIPFFTVGNFDSAEI